MRPFPLILALPLLLALIAPVAAAPVNILDGLFGVQHTSTARRTQKPKARSTKPASSKPAAAKAATPAAEEVVPLPLPRPAPAVTAPAAAAVDTNPPPPPPATDVATPPATPGAGETTTPAVGTPKTPTLPEGETATPKPPRLYQTACPAVLDGLVEATALPPITDGQCAEQSPLSVSKFLVNGRLVPLSAPATLNCGMASVLPGWVADVERFIETTQKTRIKSVQVGGSYQCRARNGDAADTSLSEHGRADAVDFVGFALEDGRQLTVEADYASTDAATRKLMQFAHAAACTRFTTVLGPDANSLHHDHFHLDLGCHGKSCTFRLCE